MKKTGTEIWCKRFAAGLIAAGMAVSLSACSKQTAAPESKENGTQNAVSSGSSKGGDKADGEIPVVTIWSSGGQEVREALQAIADAHNADPEYNNKAKVEIQFIVSGTSEQSLNDRLAAAYQANQTDTDFDLICIDDSSIAQIKAQTSEDFFEPIDLTKIPNYDNLAFKENIVGDNFIPYRGTSVYLAYNSDVVPNPPKNAEELYQWIKDNPGRFTYNDPTTGNSGFSFTANTIYNNLPEEAALSDDEKWKNDYPEVWNDGFELLAELHPYLYQTSGKVQYPMKNAGSLELLATKQVDMVPAFANMVLSQKNMGTLPESIKLTQLEEPFLGGLAGFMIPTIAKDKEAALSVIDFYLSYEAQAIDWNVMFASPVVDPTKLENLEHEDWLQETDMNSLRYFSIGTLAMDIRKRWMEEIGILAE